MDSRFGDKWDDDIEDSENKWDDDIEDSENKWDDDIEDSENNTPCSTMENISDTAHSSNNPTSRAESIKKEHILPEANKDNSFDDMPSKFDLILGPDLQQEIKEVRNEIEEAKSNLEILNKRLAS